MSDNSAPSKRATVFVAEVRELWEQPVVGKRLHYTIGDLEAALLFDAELRKEREAGEELAKAVEAFCTPTRVSPGLLTLMEALAAYRSQS